MAHKIAAQVCQHPKHPTLQGIGICVSVGRMSGSSAFPVINLLDMEAAVSNMGEPRQEALALLRSVIQDQGFLYVTNTGVDVDRVADEVLRKTEPVMLLPPEETTEFAARGFPLSGLSRFGTESVAKITGRGVYSDLCMKWTYNHLGEKNLLPPDSDGSFRHTWASAHAAWDDIAIRLLKLIGEALDLTENVRWHELFAHGRRMAMMRFLRYPDVPADRASDVGGPVERLAPHHDLGVITLLHQTPCANGFVSLEGLLDGEWVGVPAVKQSLVVNFGEVFSMLTDGAVKATMHRVVSPPSHQLEGSARQSLAMFWQPPADFIVKPLADSTGPTTANKDVGDLTFGDWWVKAFSNMCSKKETEAAAVAAAAAAAE
mmetsp:Transcript_47167/g.112251  ORF Transcript_47167/g.112251 Transcript_47167/m.112251 type:complete len:374 (+) Transcript_47167:54-1175(+)